MGLTDNIEAYTRDELATLHESCVVHFDFDGDRQVSAGEFNETTELCPLSQYSHYQQLQQIINSPRETGPSFYTNTYFYSDQGFSKVDSTSIEETQPATWNGNSRLKCLQEINEGGIVGMALGLEEDQENAQLADQIFREETLPAFRDYYRQNAIKVDETNKSDVIDALLKICPQSEWDKVELNPKQFLEDKLTLKELEVLYNNASLITSFLYIELGARFELGASMTELIGVRHGQRSDKRRGDCDMLSGEALELSHSNKQQLFNSFNIPKHATLVFLLSNGEELYFDNAMVILPPGYFDLEQKETGRSQRGQEIPLEPWQMCNGFLVELGVLNVQRKQYDAAKEKFFAALRIDPNDTGAHNNLGILYAELGEFEKAEQEYLAALRINPNHVDAHNNLGNLYADLGQVEKAEQEFFAALRIDPNDADTNNNLGNLYINLGQLEKAEREYLAAIRINSNHEWAHNNLGLLYVNLGQLEKAEKEFLAAIRIKPNHAEAHSNLGAVYAKLGQLEKAEQECLITLRIDPDHAGALKNLTIIRKSLKSDP